MSDEDSSGWELTESDPGVFTYVSTLFTRYHQTEIFIDNQGTPENARCSVHC